MYRIWPYSCFYVIIMDRFTDNGPGEEWKDFESERVEAGGQTKTKMQFQFIFQFGSVPY